MENINTEIEVQEVKELTIKEYERLRYYARKGKIYDDLIDMMKIRIGVDKDLLDAEAMSLLSDAKNEIVKLRTGMNKLVDENLSIKEDAITMAKQLHTNHKLMQVKDDAKKQKIKKLLLSSDADMVYMDLTQIDNIFEVILGEKE